MIDPAPQTAPPGLLDKPQVVGRPSSTLLRFKPTPFGKYYLLDRVNTGGMAEVFRAKAFGVEGFERIVAVKRILPSIAADTDFITMFIDEAKLAVQLNHANIAQIFDLGKVHDSYFIALEYVHGKDLRAVFDQARARARRVPVELAVYVVLKICEGLDYAHHKRDSSGRELALIHRDVSPQNMLISFDGEVKLIDFGIAKAAGQASRTRAGILKGKFGYLSPEQVAGEVIDQRSDVFGIGIVLYELLTGERLFVGDSDFSTIEKVRSLEIPSPRQLNPQISKALERVVLKALSRDRDTRYQSALELHDALQGVLHERTKRGHTFGRKELSAWMQSQFPEDAARDPEEVSDLVGAESASSSTDVTPIVEPAESNAVYKETRDVPEEAKNKHPSTILGMPAVLPPADLASPQPGRMSVPPPPPRGGMNARGAMTTRPPAPPAANFGRSVPPPPPRSQPPQSQRTLDTPASAFPAPVAPSSVPSSRSVPPPPPGASSTLPGSAQARGPSLNMDWDDEELSTQIYDRPEDAGDYLYETSEGGFDELASLRVSQLAGAGDYGQQPSHQSAPPPPPRSQSYAPNQHVAEAYGQPSQRPGSYPPNPIQGSQASHNGQYGLATQSPQSYEAPGGFASSQSFSNFPEAGAVSGEGTPPPGVHVSPRAYSISESALPRVEPAGSLRAPPSSQTMGMSTDRPQDRGRNPLYAALAVAAVVLLCFVGYVFLARTEPGVVQLTTHPADAKLSFDGKPWSPGSTSPFVITSVSPNDKHIIEVSKDGYRSWSQEVQVQAGQTLQFPVSLQPTEANEAPAVGVAQGATGGFSIETSPSGATVVLDGQELGGVTPLRVGNLLARAYDVRLKLDGFKENSAKVEVKSGVDQSLPRIVLQPLRVRVRVTSDPSGGEAIITRGAERRVLGRTPVDVTLENEGAAWNVEVSKSGYEPFAQPIAIHDGAAELTVRALLSRRAGDEAPALASSEPPRSRPSAAPATDADEAPVRAKETSGSAGGPGTLRINSRPWSQVTIDGRQVGNTPQMNVSLPAGTHKVTLVNPEFNLRKNLTINIKPGQTETQIIALQ
ncbi:MAG: serine/threonine protein kinase [Myxococcaceae bacterium]|nr:serine/threonine protein kinase [Myxococcaceae bacterium]